MVRVDYPDLHETSAGGKLTEKASEFPEEISRDRYAEAVATLEQLKLSYGVKHPKMIEQQQLVDSLKAQARSTRDASPIMDRQLLKKRYDQEMEKLDELGRKYLHRHPKIIQQKALIGEIVKDIRDVQEVVRVASPASGIVSEVRVVRDQDVKKGAILLSLDGRRARLAVQSAKVQLDLANRRLENLTVAFKAGKAIGGNVSNARAQLQLAETALAVAKIDLEDLFVRAPVDGKVVSVNAKVGEYVSPENPVVHFRPTSP